MAEVTLVLRSDTPLPTNQHGLPDRHISHAELRSGHGAHPRVQDRLQRFAAEHDLQVAEMDLSRRIARLRGRDAQLRAAFHANGKSASVPRALREDVEAVLGLGAAHRAYRRPIARM